MATLTLTLMRTLIRGTLNESSTSILSDTELNSLINDGYKDVCVKALCYESKLTKSNITASVPFVSLKSDNVIKVNYVEYDLGSSGLGMISAYPQTLGHVTINGYTPQYWFQWGDILVIEPLPDVATYDLYVYASCYPSAVLSGDSDTASCVPAEFHECILMFATSFACLKLKRWGDAAMFYNKYIESVQSKKAEYVSKYTEVRQLHDIPANVIIGQQ